MENLQPLVYGCGGLSLENKKPHVDAWKHRGLGGLSLESEKHIGVWRHMGVWGSL